MQWKKEIEKTMNHNYMVLIKDTFFENDEDNYEINMLTNNNIPGLIPVSRQMINGENRLYYEISSLVSLEEAYEKREIDYKTIKELILGCLRTYSVIEEYLLDGQQIILTPEYIYIHPETRKPKFTFYPYHSKDPREAFMELVDYILEKLDHNERETVMLGYNVYRVTRNSNFTMGDIEKLLNSKELNQNPADTKETTKWYIEERKQDIICEETVLLNSMEIEENRKQNTITKNVQDRKEEIIKKISPNMNKVPPEICGMIVGLIMIIGMGGTIAYSLNNTNWSEKTYYYLMAGIVMIFMTVLMMGYTYFKKQQNK